MGVEWSLAYVIIFLQVLAGLVLLRLPQEPRLAIRLFGVLFLANAGVSAIMALPREAAVWLASDPGWVTRSYRALDASTGFLLLAFLAARSPRPWARRGAWALVAVGTVLALLEFPFHRAMVDNEHWLRALPLYLGLGGGAYLLANGRAWERWIALALTARALYWGSAGVLDVLRYGFDSTAPVYVNRVGLVLLAFVAVAAAVRLVRRADDELPASVAVPILLIGPIATAFETGIAMSVPPSSHFRYGSVMLVNLLTLGLVRPVLAILGLARDALFGVVARATLAAGLASASTLLVPPFEIGGGGTIGASSAYGVGLLVGMLCLATLEALPPARLSFGTMPRSLAATFAPAALDRGRPQWQVLLLALRGSSLKPGVVAAAEDRLTQKALIERTGMRASRISTLVRELNMTAPQRLDAHLPNWRALHVRGAPVELVHQHRGAVQGRAGVWVYYRLTPVGEALVESLVRQIPRLDGQDPEP